MCLKIHFHLLFPLRSPWNHLFYQDCLNPLLDCQQSFPLPTNMNIFYFEVTFSSTISIPVALHLISNHIKIPLGRSCFLPSSRYTCFLRSCHTFPKNKEKNKLYQPILARNFVCELRCEKHADVFVMSRVGLELIENDIFNKNKFDCMWICHPKIGVLT